MKSRKLSILVTFVIYGIACLGIQIASAKFDNDIYVNQTCERLGLGWSMWNINGQAQLDRNWPVMMADANAKGWNWKADVLLTRPSKTNPATSTLRPSSMAVRPTSVPK